MPLYPGFQFTPDGTVRPDLVPALRALAGHSGWTVAVWLRTPTTTSTDMSPDEWLAAGATPNGFASSPAGGQRSCPPESLRGFVFSLFTPVYIRESGYQKSGRRTGV